MSARTVMIWGLATIAWALAAAACDSGGGAASAGPTGVATGEQSIGPEEGIDLMTGTKVESANFANSDLYATSSAGHLKLAPGGDSPIVYNPVNWFWNGGAYATFDALENVPSQLPPSGENGTALTHPRTGNAFVIRTHDGDWSRGWIAEAADDHILIQFAPVE